LKEFITTYNFMESLTVEVIGKVAAGVDHHDFCYEGVSGNGEVIVFEFAEFGGRGAK
jgi:hypothetical protein